MSDFFKKETPQETPKEEKSPPEVEKEDQSLKPTTSKIPIKEIQKEAFPITEATQPISIKDASDIMLSKIKVSSLEETEKLYQDSLALIKAILEQGLKNEPIEVKEIKEHIDKLVNQLSLGNVDLINLTNNSTPENYLYAHSVNVSILSIMLGIGLVYTKEQLSELGVASFLHDIGMVKVTDVSSKVGKLTDEEYNKIKQHPIYGMDMLEMVKDISQAAIYVAQEHHERTNGRGYPKGLKGNDIDEYAKIVATVDNYEALTHPRSYRERLHPYEAIRDILKNKEHFDFKFLKVLIEKIGIFPLGSWVQLSTNEMGIVTKVNKDSPLKPIVRIVLDPQERKLAEERIIDLSTNPTIYVKKPVNVDELDINK
ncbi:MAG: HD-GYP domain-containing protein [Candidatus Omnitrophota bacterium]|nr:HD-GYP domain-containing protein [Candidatus Omnitrophota bacterium]